MRNNRNNTYWGIDGKHQKTYDRLKVLIPDNGRADSMHIELLRCASNLYHDFYNNGAGNLSVLVEEISLIRNWGEEIKAKMRSVRGPSPFDKIIDACMADAVNESNLISTMLENRVTAVYDGYEKIMDAIILVVEERERNAKFVLVEAGRKRDLFLTSSVLKRAKRVARDNNGREKQCEKWFNDAKPGDCLMLSPQSAVFCILRTSVILGKLKKVEDVQP